MLQSNSRVSCFGGRASGSGRFVAVVKTNETIASGSYVFSIVARFTAPPNMVNSAVHTGTEAISHLAIKNHGSWVWVSPVRAFFPKPLRRTDLIRLPLSLAAWRRNGCPGRRLVAAGHLMPGVNGSGLGCIDGTERAQQQSVRTGRVQLRVESPNEQVCGTL